ncbi:phage integrase SAM-like domain-containing protein [Rufibacter latericius]|uniref:Phage integrase SAM-like domain-containing protein n=1 Tax=Rufibacter latericius TaxID=2487040 RepID=A0A3M9M916_9BACT|nr:phage integrase SAM-like domain-containing protein [Rufibacter latericius]RNI22051.1 hypothetical protein EFB08_23245 [Rufibacter latericius]
MVSVIRKKPTNATVERAPDFHYRFKEFMDYKKQAVEYATFQKFNTLHNYLIEFEKKTGYKVDFGSINDVFEYKFIDYLSKVKGNFNDTIAKNFTTLKTFMNWAPRYRYHNNQEFGYLSIPNNVSVPLALTLPELKKLLSLELSNNPRLKKIRDRFVSNA